METKRFSNSSHRRSTAARLLGVPSAQSGPSTGDSSFSGGDFNEDDVFWTSDLVEPNHRPNNPFAAGKSNDHFRTPESHGILAALPDSDLNMIIETPLMLNRKTSFPPSIRAVPAIPKPPHISLESKQSQSLPVRRFHRSAPMNVPVLSKARSSSLAQADDDDEAEDEMLPPHEIVARGSGRSPKTTSSVLEGVGRTLKGRDLRQVRNAVWHKTGFLD
ncbi:hypothetical protein PVL29_010517 [Vitis rotundifolia]|uniref:Senescence regulator n=1 Tax=Vitis rotundifolia TaxID=103349 RepID=A0AA38ZTR0_VITRO|nr:hypothetical protein PVL29_010517 [Vitis rotundifolia]